MKFWTLVKCTKALKTRENGPKKAVFRHKNGCSPLDTRVSRYQINSIQAVASSARTAAGYTRCSCVSTRAASAGASSPGSTGTTACARMGP